MARDRLDIHEKFIDILETRGLTISRVYFQPPESVRMEYPCIRYSKSIPNLKRANGKIYNDTACYEVTVIDYDPDSEIPKKILETFPMCGIDQFYTADNLYHTKFTLYH
jgi:hypothetical protein